jgi:superfamily II DNA or RNA helicase
MPRPKIAAVRDPGISPVIITDFPIDAQVQVKSDRTNSGQMVALTCDLLLDFSHVRMESMDLHEYEARLTASDPLRGVTVDFGQPQLTGKKYKSMERREISGSPPLPRSYKPIVERNKIIPKSVPDTIDLLRPTLEMSVFLTEVTPPVLPYPLRDDQMEAIFTLINREALLLADDAGMGKTVTAITALSALFQQGEIRRALIACSKTGLRHWSGQLITWAPFLTFTTVQGNPDQRDMDWQTPAHLYLVDYSTLAIDIAGGLLAGENLNFDLLVFDGLHMIRFREREMLEALKRVSARRRWGLTGALPKDEESWLSVFTFLIPDGLEGARKNTLPELQSRFESNVLRRTKREMAKAMPPQIRQEIWLDLQERQMKVYEKSLEEERNRLVKLGGAVTRTHVMSAVERLKRVCNFAPELLDGVKVRALVDLVDEVSSAGSKIVVITQFQEDGVEKLMPVLEAYGALRIDQATPDDQRDEMLSAFRQQVHWNVLLVEAGTRLDGKGLKEATYVVHFDHNWNPAVRRRLERRLNPSIGPKVPINIYEFWVADTIEERLYEILAERGMLPHQVPMDTQPVELEERITLEDWLQDIFEVPVHPTPAFKLKKQLEEAKKELEKEEDEGRETLPDTAMLISHVESLQPEGIISEIGQLLGALGYPETVVMEGSDEDCTDLLAWRSEKKKVERVFVRYIRAEKNVGVGEGRSVLEAMESQGNCDSAYLIVTTDFTRACKELADESGDRLLLISGGELRRHLRIMGRL